MKRDGNSESLWQVSTEGFTPNLLQTNTKKFDVIIAGGGITGITTGLQLQKAGRTVLICEAQTIGFGTTGGTTAHLNTFLDTPYHAIQKRFSRDDAKLVATAVLQALELIRRNVAEYN